MVLSRFGNHICSHYNSAEDYVIADHLVNKFLSKLSEQREYKKFEATLNKLQKIIKRIKLIGEDTIDLQGSTLLGVTESSDNLSCVPLHVMKRAALTNHNNLFNLAMLLTDDGDSYHARGKQLRYIAPPMYDSDAVTLGFLKQYLQENYK